MLHIYDLHLLRALREFGTEMQRAATLEDAEQRSLAVSGVGAVAINMMAKKIGMIVGTGAVLAGNHNDVPLQRYIKAQMKQIEDTIKAVSKEYIKNAMKVPDDPIDPSAN